jgi:fibronectin-binding autotransporter adhesin
MSNQQMTSKMFLKAAFAALALFSVDVAYAAVVDTTGATIVLNAGNPQNTYIGDGALQISGDVGLASSEAIATTEFAMTGGLIIIDSGKKLTNGGWQRGLWTANKADMQLNGTLDVWDGSAVYVNALSGSGAVTLLDASWATWWNGFKQLRVGVNGGSGTYAGSINWGNAERALEFIKDGAGTQVLSNVVNQSFGKYTLNAGILEFCANSDVSLSVPISGAGALAKSGSGTLTLPGASIYVGAAIVSAGTLVVSNGFGGVIAVSIASNASLRIDSIWTNDTAAIAIASGATLNLNVVGTHAVGMLSIAGFGALPVGVYDATHPTYGSSFAGTGSLEITTASASSPWTAPGSGNWGDAGNWLDSIVPTGYGTATFNASTDSTVTLDAARTIGNLDFGVSGYTLTGSALTLKSAGTRPTVTVATGSSARIENVLAGTSGLVKSGGGTLTLTADNTYSGATTVSAGTLVATKVFNSATAVTIASGATLRLDSARTDWPGGNLFSGAGTLILNPGAGNTYHISGYNGLTLQMAAGGLIRVQSGTVEQSWGFNCNWGGNQAGLTIDSGAAFDVWDAYGIQIDALNGSGTLKKTSGGWNTTHVKIGQAGGSGTFAGNIFNTVGGLRLEKVGAGTQTLTGSNSYTGTTDVNNGTLRIDGDSSGALGALTVASGAFLGGNGSYGGNITLNAGAGLRCDVTLSDCTLACGGQLSFSNLDFTKCTFTLAPMGGYPAYRSYTLIEAASLGTATFANAEGTIAGVPANLYVKGSKLMLGVGYPGTVLSLF